jgi:hypothetical protein
MSTAATASRGRTRVRRNSPACDDLVGIVGMTPYSGGPKGSGTDATPDGANLRATPEMFSRTTAEGQAFGKR